MSEYYTDTDTDVRPADTFLSLANEYVRARDHAADLGLKIASLTEEQEKVAAKRDAIKRQMLEHLEPASKALAVDAEMKAFQARGGIR